MSRLLFEMFEYVPKYHPLRLGKMLSSSGHILFSWMKPCIWIAKQTTNNQIITCYCSSMSIIYIYYFNFTQSMYIHPLQWYLFYLHFYTVTFQQCTYVIRLTFFLQFFIKHCVICFGLGWECSVIYRISTDELQFISTNINLNAWSI